MASATTTAVLAAPATPGRRAQTGFIVAWVFCLFFYFGQYALRSAPGVMVPELTATFGLTTLGVSSPIGLYYYTYSTFAIIAGAALDRFGAKYVIPAGIFITAACAIMFGLGSAGGADRGRLFQGAGSAFSFTGSVYLASRGFTSRYLATAVGFTQCFGMLGGAAGRFAVGPMIHGLISWQQFWIFAGVALIILAVLVLVATPAGHDARPTGSRSLLSVFGPYKLPTTIGDMESDV